MVRQNPFLLRPSFLKWPYLQQLGRLGRNFRLPMSLQKVQEHLDEDLQAYVNWYASRRPHLIEVLQAMGICSEAECNGKCPQ